MISFGPDINHAHSPDEEVSVPSVGGCRRPGGGAALGAVHALMTTRPRRMVVTGCSSGFGLVIAKEALRRLAGSLGPYANQPMGRRSKRLEARSGCST